MKPPSFDSAVWVENKTISGCSAVELQPIVKRLEAANDWSSSPSGVDDWDKLRRELVEGSSVSSASETILSWLIYFLEDRSSADALLVWTLIGEVEFARLSGDSAVSIEPIIEQAREKARLLRVQGRPRAQTEHFAMVEALPDLPSWGRMLLLRLVLIGERYVLCPRCDEIITVKWRGEWQVGDCVVTPQSTSVARLAVFQRIEEAGAHQGAISLQSVARLDGLLRCDSCTELTDVVTALAQPLAAPS